jgi:hypothetical protein
MRTVLVSHGLKLAVAACLAAVVGTACVFAVGNHSSVTITMLRMNSPRHFHTSTPLTDGRVLIAGGDELGTAELFDPSTSSFKGLGKMTHVRMAAMAVLLMDGRVLIAGGDSIGSAELFDPKTETFMPTGSMDQLHRGGTMTLLADGKVLVAGGSVDSGDHSSAMAELYDPVAGSFAVTGSMRQPRLDFTATLVPNLGVLVVGGHSAGITNFGLMPTDTAEIYDPSSGTFRLAANLGEARWQHTATLLHDGGVLIAGGCNATQLTPGVNSAERFDPATGKFSAITWPAHEGCDETASLLPDGKVFLLSGLVVLLYDDASASFTGLDIRSWPDRRQQTLLADGRVLVSGGDTGDNHNPATDEAAIYTLPS